MKFIAYTVKGLENMAADEITSVIAKAKIISISDKAIVFEADFKNIEINKLRVVDDISLLLLQIVKPKKLSAEDIIDQIKTINILDTYNLIKGYRSLNNIFSITFSVSGVRLKKDELEENIAKYIKKKFDLVYTPKNHDNFDIRLFLNRTIGFITIRLTPEPLYKRGYKVESSMGSLKPTVAAAMVMLLNYQSHLEAHQSRAEESPKIVDNFCGSGTILCEANILGFDVYGGDILGKNVSNTKSNLSNIESITKKSIKVVDATSTSWRSGYFDCAVSNLPWDKQVSVDSITDLYIQTLQEYKRILKPNASLCFLVHKPQILIKYAKKYFPSHKISTTKVSFTGQSPTIVTLLIN